MSTVRVLYKDLPSNPEDGNNLLQIAEDCLYLSYKYRSKIDLSSSEARLIKKALDYLHDAQISMDIRSDEDHPLR